MEYVAIVLILDSSKTDYIVIEHKTKDMAKKRAKEYALAQLKARQDMITYELFELLPGNLIIKAYLAQKTEHDNPRNGIVYFYLQATARLIEVDTPVAGAGKFRQVN